MNYLIPFILFAVALVPLALAGFGVIKSAKGKKIALILNIVMVFAFVVIGSALMFGQTVSAAEANDAAQAAEDAGENVSGGKLATMSIGAGLGMLAAALVTALSCVGAGIAVAPSASAAIGAISENPKAFGKSIIFVALAEGVALYGMIISLQILQLLR